MQETPTIGAGSRQNRLPARLSLACLVAVAISGACTDRSVDPKGLRSGNTLTACDAEAYLTVETFGAIEGRIEWRGNDLECEGMRRPHGRGARLRFSGEHSWDLDDTEEQDRQRSGRIAFILSLPKAKEGKTAKELRTGVTLIEENEGRFFGTQNADNCWSDIESQTPALDTAGKAITGRYIISGITYCLTPIAEINGTASVTLSHLKFRGRLDWKH